MSRRDQLNKSMAVLFPQVRETTAEIDGRERTVFVPDNSACRVCTEDVVDGRWNYCSERCREIAQAVQAKFLWTAVREQVLERDDHTCQSCGLSKEQWWRAYWQAQERIDERTAYLKAEDMDAWRQERRRLSERYDVDCTNGRGLSRRSHQADLRGRASARRVEPPDALSGLPPRENCG